MCMEKSKLLSIIIPVYNEEQFVYALLDKVTKTSFASYNIELIIVNDWSKDTSEQEINRFIHDTKDLHIPITYAFQNNKGKWSAIKHGITLASWDIFMIQDADLEYNPENIQEWLLLFEQNKTKVVYGSRTRGFLRYWFTYSTLFFFVWWVAVSVLTSILWITVVTDEPTCYKLFDQSCKKRLLLPHENGFEREPAVTMLLLRKWFGYKERPIEYFPRKVTSGKKIKLKDGFKALWTLLYRRCKNV